MCVVRGMYVWKSEDNFLVLSFHLYMCFRSKHIARFM